MPVKGPYFTYGDCHLPWEIIKSQNQISKMISLLSQIINVLTLHMLRQKHLPEMETITRLIRF